MLKTPANPYSMFFSSIMAIYRDNFEETRKFPVAYASAVVTVILSFIWIALSYFLIRTQIWPHGWISFPNYLLFTKLEAFVALVVFYLCHCIYFARKERWKLALIKFDALNPNHRRTTFLILTLVSVCSVAWMISELEMAL